MMDEGILIAFASYLATALLFIGLALPLIRRKIPRNKWYGFRFKGALKNDDIWYDTNQFGGWLLLISGVITLALSIGLVWAEPEQINLYISIITAVILIESIVLVIAPLIYVKRKDQH